MDINEVFPHRHRRGYRLFVLVGGRPVASEEGRLKVPDISEEGFKVCGFAGTGDAETLVEAVSLRRGGPRRVRVTEGPEMLGVRPT
ncbi:hypothetical protein V5799_004478 [Amblyomma americanum]|uniref:Uncharacterized protein n=1 Tax=Amblyomma americanum TaxID=6943 RepID=A0AAQ4D601_AMBAM